MLFRTRSKKNPQSSWIKDIGEANPMLLPQQQNITSSGSQSPDAAADIGSLFQLPPSSTLASLMQHSAVIPFITVIILYQSGTIVKSVSLCYRLRKCMCTNGYHSPLSSINELVLFHQEEEGTRAQQRADPYRRIWYAAIDELILPEEYCMSP